MKQRQRIIASNNNNMRNPIIKDVGRGYTLHYCWIPLSSAFALYCTFFICLCLQTTPLTSCNIKGNSITVILTVGKLCPRYCLIPGLIDCLFV